MVLSSGLVCQLRGLSPMYCLESRGGVSPGTWCKSLGGGTGGGGGNKIFLGEVTKVGLVFLLEQMAS